MSAKTPPTDSLASERAATPAPTNPAPINIGVTEAATTGECVLQGGRECADEVWPVGGQCRQPGPKDKAGKAPRWPRRQQLAHQATKAPARIGIVLAASIVDHTTVSILSWELSACGAEKRLERGKSRSKARPRLLARAVRRAAGPLRTRRSEYMRFFCRLHRGHLRTTSEPVTRRCSCNNVNTSLSAGAVPRGAVRI